VTTLQRYLWIQVPGWVLAAIIASALYLWAGLHLWIAVALFVAYVGKDFILFPFLRRAYETNTKTGVEELIGMTGKVAEELRPRGYVRVRGELWRAETAPGTSSIPKGSSVKIQSAHGMTLVVSVEAGPQESTTVD
jgi:membrane protein implicated in regulation of membrane protease activity